MESVDWASPVNTQDERLWLRLLGPLCKQSALCLRGLLPLTVTNFIYFTLCILYSGIIGFLAEICHIKSKKEKLHDKPRQQQTPRVGHGLCCHETWTVLNSDVKSDCHNLTYGSYVMHQLGPNGRFT